MTPKTLTIPPSPEGLSLEGLVHAVEHAADTSAELIRRAAIGALVAMLGGELEEAELCERFRFRVRLFPDLEDGQLIWEGGPDRILNISDLNSPHLRRALLWCAAREALGRELPEGLLEDLAVRAKWRHAAPTAAWREAIELDRRELDLAIAEMERRELD